MISRKYILKFLVILFGVAQFTSCDSQTEEIPNEIEVEEPSTNENDPEITTPTSGNTLLITNGMSFSELNNILNTAVSGDTVEVEPGTYQINGTLNLKSGVSLHKQTSTAPIFDAQTTSPNNMLEQYLTSNNSNMDIYGIQFRNIRFNLQNAYDTQIRYCIFDYGVRKTETTKAYTSDAYISLYKSSDTNIIGCVFKRRLENSGRGIYTNSCTNTQILNNIFGDTDATSYFVTAINDNSDGTLIKENTIKRMASWVNLEETDHGIYTHSFKNLTITDNTISGWPANSSGGALKVRNGENATITNNTLNDSGILLYVYSNTPLHPFLKNVIIENNTINVLNATNDIYHGIGYYRNTSDANFSEYSIRIANNNLVNGRIKISAPVSAVNFNASNGGVFNNNMAVLDIATGIANSGNE